MDNCINNKYTFEELVNMECEIKCYFSASDYKKNGCGHYKRNCKECDSIEDCYNLACIHCSEEVSDSLDCFGFDSMEEFWDSTI